MPPLTPDIPAAPLFGEPVTQHPSHDVLDFLATRRSASAVKLIAPGPDRAEVETLVRLASRVPDHGKLAPWRFIVLETRAKAEFADGLEALAIAKGDSIAAGKLAKVRAPPLAIAVVSSPRTGKIPEWEQRLSAGAVCTTLLYAGLACMVGGLLLGSWTALRIVNRFR